MKFVNYKSAGVYKDVELSATDSGEDEGSIQETTNELQGLYPNYSDDSYTLLEIHVDLDLEGFEDLDMQGHSCYAPLYCYP